MDGQTIALIVGLASLAVGVVGVAATLLVQGHRREQKAHAETGGMAVAGDQHVGGSVVTGAGAVVADRAGTALNITAQPGATVNVYVDGLPQAKGEVHDHFEEGRRLQTAEQHEAAIREFERALAAAESATQRCALHILTGVSFYRLSRLPEAEGHYRQALELGERGGDRPGQAAALGNLGLVYGERGDLDKAEEHLKRGLAWDEEAGNKLGQARHLSSLGNVCYRRGDLDKSQEYHKKALAIHQDIGDKTGQAIALDNLGLAYGERGDLDKAEEHLKRALALSEEIGDKYIRGWDLGGLGSISAYRGDLDGAEEHLRRALVILEEIGDRFGQAIQVEELGVVYAQRRNDANALVHLKRARDMFADIGASRDVARVDQLIAWLKPREAGPRP